MYKFVTFICNFVLLVRVATTTDVGGALLQDTIWTKANNPYNVIADVHVPLGVTLTIKAGVKVTFDGPSDFGIFVNGSCYVQGIAGQRVLFNGSKLYPSYNSKWMIDYKIPSLSQSSIAYAQFIGPKRAVRIAQQNPDINVGEFIISYCIFTGTQIFMGTQLYHPAVGSTTNAVTIRDSTLTDSTLSNYFASNGFINFISNTFQNVELDVMSIYDTVKMAGCRGGNLTIHWRCYPGRYFEINDTILTDVYIDHGASITPEATFIIRRSTLRNATIDMFGGYVDYIRGTLNIISSKLTIPRAIEMESGTIECSSITSVGDKSNSTGIIAGSISITNSSIFDFDVGLRIANFSKPMGNINNNNFYRNSRYNIDNGGTFDVNAIGNWWGRQNKIGVTLYDKCDDDFYGKIYYDNYSKENIGQQC